MNVIEYPQFTELLGNAVKAAEFVTTAGAAVSLEKAFLGASGDTAKKSELEKAGLFRETLALLSGNSVPEEHANLVGIEVTAEFAKKVGHLCEVVDGKTVISFAHVLEIGYRLSTAKEAREKVTAYFTPSEKAEIRTGGPAVKFTVVIPQEKPEVKK